MNTITVIGAGPIGLNTAIKLKEEGWIVEVLEEHSSIGKPVNCSGLVSLSGLNELNLNVNDSALNYIKGARIYSPSGNTIEIKREKPVAVVLDREKFDLSFYEKAKKTGLRIQFNSKLINIKNNSVFFQKNSHGEMIKSNIIVGADGVNSKTREIIGLKMPASSFIHAYQEKIVADFDSDLTEVFLSNEHFPGFFAWLIPSSNSTGELGLGVKLGTNIKPAITYFKELLKAKGFEFETTEKKSFMIPNNKMPDFLTKDNILLTGDAAFQTKATTGGGIITGLLSSNTAVETINSHLKNKKPLDNYDKNLNSVRKELLMHWKIRNYLNSLSDKKIDNLFIKLKKAGIESFLEEYGDMDKPSKFIPLILKKPRMWSLAFLALKFR